jgi:hypothetical protein
MFLVDHSEDFIVSVQNKFEQYRFDVQLWLPQILIWTKINDKIVKIYRKE